MPPHGFEDEIITTIKHAHQEKLYLMFSATEHTFNKKSVKQ